MPTTGVLIGEALADFIARNRELLDPTVVTIPGGAFMMGAGADYGAHQATISTFQMGRTPVTNEQYASYLASLGGRRYAMIGEVPATKTLGLIAVGPSEDEVTSTMRSVVDKGAHIMLTGGLGVVGEVAIGFLDALEFLHSQKIAHIKDYVPSDVFDRPRQPVIDVSWYEAFVYAFLHGGMLPTEWQWEYAARVVQGREGLRDYATPSGRLTIKEAHYDAYSTADVDDPGYPTLENGLRHMTGNVWE